MEEFDQKLNRLTDVVTAMAELQARTAESNPRAFAVIERNFQKVEELIAANAKAIESNACAIQALADRRD